ncbi:DUF6345 domain-containing protein [Plantactinospora sp. KBS50]|uniref:DUF6345 domain-containing protein n=1 Tax=Plantactinospora sp. KBS50 TaxID=2024580 RepID=UPI000BAAAE0E|nr:DUF6345 domain-containing protein [Plantactinospora sp. KBS50]ASW55547.1 hypothetical protein CIK06_17250 [Plantactinospora sp. KBS50]
MVGALGLTATDGSALAAETELPVYAVRAAGLDEGQAAELGKAFGIDVAREKDGSVRFADEKAFLAVPTVDGGQGREDEDGNPTTASLLDVAALRKIKPIDRETALRSASEALARAGLYPEGATATVGNTTFESVDGNGKSIVSAALDTTVAFSFALDKLPYEGPGAKVRVAFDGSGAVSQLSYSTRTLVADGTVPVLDLAAGRERCEKAMGGAVTVREPAYAYYAPALAERLDRVEPSFRCAGVNGDGTPAQVLFVPAAVDASLPELPPPPPPRDNSLRDNGLRANSLGATGLQASIQAYGVADVGSEGTGPCSGLPHTGSNLASFNNRMSSAGYPVEFSWLDQNAWEDDFKDPAYSGHDSNWTDHVDMTYWQGHGSPTGFSFSGCSSTDDTFLSNTEARWGNGDVEWMSLFTCLVLAHDSGGKAWWQRWGNAFDGLHQINSFDTVSYHSASHGGTFANYMVRTPFLWWNKPMSVRAAWAQASIDDQPSSVRWATMGPIGPGGLVNLNDYFWGKGSVGPDVPATQRTGWWYVSGLS